MTDKKMKTWTIRTEGDRMEVALADAAIPEPGPNQVLVKVHAASLNRGEFIAGHGLHKAGSPPKPVGMMRTSAPGLLVIDPPWLTSEVAARVRKPWLSVAT